MNIGPLIFPRILIIQIDLSGKNFANLFANPWHDTVDQ